MITLRFSSWNTFKSLAIRKFTHSEYSHVDFVISDGIYLGALPHGGVIIHNQKADKELFVSFKIENEDKIIEFLLSQKGKPYDFKAIFGIPFNRDWQEDDRWFCSELIAAAINKVIPIFNEEKWRITPQHLLDGIKQHGFL